MSYTASEYWASIEASLDDLRAAGEAVPISVLRGLDRHVEGIRNLWVEYRVPEKNKTLVEVFAKEDAYREKMREKTRALRAKQKAA